jgi:hypothetical protein
MVAQRVFGIALDYEDLVDHDLVLATLPGKPTARCKGCAPLAKQEHLEPARACAVAKEPLPQGRPQSGGDRGTVRPTSSWRRRRRRPRRSFSILDVTDDPLHGHQEDRFFHGYYDGYCCLRVLRQAGVGGEAQRSNIEASAGAVEEVVRVVSQIRARWPGVAILLRAESSFAQDELMACCEANRVDCVFGLAAATAWSAPPPMT